MNGTSTELADAVLLASPSAFVKVPLFLHVDGMVYWNKELFEKKGIAYPATFDDMVKAAEALTNPDEGTFGFVAYLLNAFSLAALVGVEFVKDRTTREPASELVHDLVQRAFRQGLLLLGAGKSTLRLAPPLVVDEHDVDAGAGRDIGDAGAHEAGAEHADLPDPGGRGSGRPARALVELLHGDEQRAHHVRRLRRAQDLGVQHAREHDRGPVPEEGRDVFRRREDRDVGGHLDRVRAQFRHRPARVGGAHLGAAPHPVPDHFRAPHLADMSDPSTIRDEEALPVDGLVSGPAVAWQDEGDILGVDGVAARMLDRDQVERALSSFSVLTVFWQPSSLSDLTGVGNIR